MEIPCRGQTRGARAGASPREEPTDEADLIHLGMKHFEEHHDFGPVPHRPEQSSARGRASSGPRGSPVTAQDRDYSRLRRTPRLHTSLDRKIGLYSRNNHCLRGLPSAQP